MQISWEFLGKFGFSNIGDSLSLPLALPGMWMLMLGLQQPSCDSEENLGRWILTHCTNACNY